LTYHEGLFSATSHWEVQEHEKGKKSLNSPFYKHTIPTCDGATIME
jgi:dihydroorotase-like cyclic amidohydrolase